MGADMRLSFSRGFFALLSSLLVLQENYCMGVQTSRKILCMQEGIGTFSHECTVTDSLMNPLGSTIWTGNTFNCMDSSNQILLPHYLYAESGVTSACGNFSAMSVSVQETEYTSRLSFFGNSLLQLDGITINCTLSGTMLVDTITIRVGVLPPPPEQLTTTLSSDLFLNISWSPPSDRVEGGVGGYAFGVTGEGCGCESMNISADTTSVTCSKWTATGQTCSFEVRTLSQDCRFSSISAATNTITLSVPQAPQNLIVEPTYGASGSIEVVTVYFNAVDESVIGTDIDEAISYVVSFTGQTILQFTNVTCNSFTKRCSLTVDGSQLSNNEWYIIGVMAINAVSHGSSNFFSNRIFTNIMEIVRLSIDTTASTVHCDLLSSYVETIDAVCSITYGYPPENCERYTDSSVFTTGGPGVNLTITLSHDVNNTAEFCYTVSLKYGVTILKIVGNFSLAKCDPSVLGDDPSSLSGAGFVKVSNGAIVYDGVRSGSMAHLLCNNGYVASEGIKDRVCLSHGTWSEQAQVCHMAVVDISGKTESDIHIAIPITLTFLLSLILGVVIGAFSVQGWNKYARKSEKNSNNDSVIEPNVSDLFTSTNENPSYKHIQPPDSSSEQTQSEVPLQQTLQQRSSPLYENPEELK